MSKARETLCIEIPDAYQGMDHEHKIQTEGIPLLPEDQQAAPLRISTRYGAPPRGF